MPALPPLLRGGRSLLFLVGAGLLLIALTACAGGGDETAASSPGTDTPPGTEPPDTEPPGNEPPGTNPPGNEPPGTEPPDTEPPGNEPPGTNPPGNQPPSDTDTSIRGLDCLNEEGEDCDGDGHNDSVDIDDDGDGLIEIATAEELDAVRYALNGNGSKSSADAAFDTTGCGGSNGIVNCSGYELVANISLATYANSDGSKGWRPLGHDTGNSADDICHGARFDGIFDGNGFRISDLMINRPNEDCVGLFGQVAVDSVIRNFSIHAETIEGDDRVGGLVGHIVNATITSSSISIGNISGSNRVGGLVGDGVGEGTEIHYSSVVAGQVIGTGDQVGGLIGRGEDIWIHSSSVVVAEVSGNDDVGGLVGVGGDASGTSEETVGATIFSSSVVAGEVSGSIGVGGLVGWGETIWIHSSSVVAGEVSGADDVGGLIGIFDNGRIAYSYVISGSNTNMLVGVGSGGTGVASYWDSDTSDIDNGDYGEAKTSNELRMPTRYERIYAKWDDNPVMFDDGSTSDEPLAVWCDEDNNRIIEEDEQIDDNLIWDFGTSSQYPAIRCTPTAPSEWRGWWSLNGTGKPQLNSTRLDGRLP